MAIVTKHEDGYFHLSNDLRTTLDTLCGICDDPANRQVKGLIEIEGKITCPVCRGVALVVFESCKKSEVKAK